MEVRDKAFIDDFGQRIREGTPRVDYYSRVVLR